MNELINEYMSRHPGASREMAELNIEHFGVNSFSDLDAMEGRTGADGESNSFAELENLIVKRQAEKSISYSEAFKEIQTDRPELVTAYINDLGYSKGRPTTRTPHQRPYSSFHI